MNKTEGGPYDIQAETDHSVFNGHRASDAPVHDSVLRDRQFYGARRRQAGDSAVNITVPSLSDIDASFTATGNNAIVGIGQVDGKITTVKYGTFLTSHQSLADYATHDWVNSSLANYSKGNSEIYKGTCSTGANTALRVPMATCARPVFSRFHSS